MRRHLDSKLRMWWTISSDMNPDKEILAQFDRLSARVAAKNEEFSEKEIARDVAVAVSRMREQAAEAGIDRLGKKQIKSEVRAARRTGGER